MSSSDVSGLILSASCSSFSAFNSSFSWLYALTRPLAVSNWAFLILDLISPNLFALLTDFATNAAPIPNTVRTGAFLIAFLAIFLDAVKAVFNVSEFLRFSIAGFAN